MIQAFAYCSRVLSTLMAISSSLGKIALMYWVGLLVLVVVVVYQLPSSFFFPFYLSSLISSTSLLTFPVPSLVSSPPLKSSFLQGIIQRTSCATAGLPDERILLDVVVHCMVIQHLSRACETHIARSKRMFH